MKTKEIIESLFSKKTEKTKKIIGTLFWYPLFANLLISLMGYWPLKVLYWHLAILGIYFLVVILGIAAFYGLIYLGFKSKPKGFIQRMVFPLWMWHLKHIEITNPLIAFPYIMQVTIMVPKVFKEEGMESAHQALIKWMNEFPESMVECLKAISAERAKFEERCKNLQNQN
jgi:hypothetical protein